MPDPIEDRRPLPLVVALVALARCVAATVRLLARNEVTLPRNRVGTVLGFADGSHGRVYRETVIRSAPTDDPAVLVVAFRLRWVHGRGHAAFRAESLLNTILFAGFPGLVSKLWLAHDERGVYRGFYQWNGAALADSYVRALWWVLALVSERGSIRSVVLPGLRRDDVLRTPEVMAEFAPRDGDGWWRLTSVGPPTTDLAR